MTRALPPRAHRASEAGFLPFLTPVRGHAFAARPPTSAAPVGHGAPANLVREPDNPADPYAIAVWATGEGLPWRVGYVERAVAARLAPRLDRGMEVTATLAGWWEEPSGRWQRPVVALQPSPAPRVSPATPTRTIWARPPGSRVRPVSGTRPARS